MLCSPPLFVGGTAESNRNRKIASPCLRNRLASVSDLAGKKQFDCLSEYGLKIGLGFQIANDILDVSGSSERLGKTAGKDAKAGKTTYPSVFGMKKSLQLSEKLADEAVACLKSFGTKADILRQLALALFQRTK